MANKKKKSNRLIAKLKEYYMLIVVLVIGIPMLYFLFVGEEKAEAEKKKPLTTIHGTYEVEGITPVTLHEAELLYVVDGDTLYCVFNDMEVYVRLIGVDTAESVNPDEDKNNEFGEMAKEYTMSLLKGHEVVYLEFGDTMNDKYGRILAYVWLNPEVSTSSPDSMASYMLNYILLDKGYAYDMPVAPNLKYVETFEKACEDAKITNTGLWSYKTYRSLYSAK